MIVTIKYKDGGIYRVIHSVVNVKLETTYAENYSCYLIVTGGGHKYGFDTGRYDFEITEGRN